MGGCKKNNFLKFEMNRSNEFVVVSSSMLRPSDLHRHEAKFYARCPIWIYTVEY